MTERKLAAAGLILGSGVYAGLRAAAELRAALRQLHSLSAALTVLRAELRYAHTGFSGLCSGLAERFAGKTGAFFLALGKGAEADGCPGPGSTASALQQAELRLPRQAEQALAELFDGFGLCDAEGQLAQLEAASARLEQAEEGLRSGLSARCRLRAVLGVCGGAAAVLLTV